MPRTPAARAAMLLPALLLIASPAPAADWPGWLGPEQNGSSPETGLFNGDETALELAWSRDLGIAYSGIAVVGGRAITMFGDGTTDWLIALDSGSGSEIWRYRIGAMHPKVGSADGGQLSTPVVHRKTVYGLGAAGQLFAVRLSDGVELWSTNIASEHGAKPPTFGFTTNPIVAGKVLFVQTGGTDGHGFTGFDLRTGKSRWSRGEDAVGYQSPVYATLSGRRQIIAVTSTSVHGIDPASGSPLWRTEHGLSENWATPILLGKKSFVLTGGSESAAFEVDRQGGTFKASELWRTPTLRGTYGMPVVYDGHLYGFDSDFLSCVDAATGRQIWMKPIVASGLILVDRHLVLFAWNGEVVAAPASPVDFQPVGRVKVAEKNGFTYPSFADGGIFVRNLKTIARVNVVH